jgi:LAS superfamily LD-carboxypeptidase LdcB
MENGALAKMHQRGSRTKFWFSMSENSVNSRLYHWDSWHWQLRLSLLICKKGQIINSFT